VGTNAISTQTRTITSPTTIGSSLEQIQHATGTERTSRYWAPTGAPTREDPDVRPSDAITPRVTFESLINLEVERVGFTPDSVYVEYAGRPPISESNECPRGPSPDRRPGPGDGRDDDRTQRQLVVRPWVDPVVEANGFAVCSPYVETVVLPILGPSATLCLRRLGTWVAVEPRGVSVDLAALAGDLGLGRGIGRQSPIRRTLDRLCQFGMSAWQGRDLMVRTAVAPVTERQLSRLSPQVVLAHRSMVTSLVSRRR